MSTNKIYFTTNISWCTKHVRFRLSLPINVTVSIFTVSAFIFLTLTPNVPILFTAIPQHTTIKWTEKPTDVTISILFVYWRISTCFGPTGPSSREFTQLFTTTIGSVSVPFRPCALYNNIQSMRPERYRHWTNGCVNSYVNSPEDGPVGTKHVEIRDIWIKLK